jgi:hypothetical protein
VEKAKHNQERKAVEKGQVAEKAREESLSKKEPVHHRHLFSKEHQSHAGKMLVEKRGREYMSLIGKRGYATTLARYPNFHLEGGKASWRKQNRQLLDQGYFPNQSLEQWNYCQKQGCHRPKSGQQPYCSQHLSNKGREEIPF